MNVLLIAGLVALLPPVGPNSPPSVPRAVPQSLPASAPGPMVNWNSGELQTRAVGELLLEGVNLKVLKEKLYIQHTEGGWLVVLVPQQGQARARMVEKLDPDLDAAAAEVVTIVRELLEAEHRLPTPEVLPQPSKDEEGDEAYEAYQPQDEDIEDEAFEEEQEPLTSADKAIAVLLSVVVGYGTGQFYLGQDNAFIFLFAELLGLGALIGGEIVLLGALVVMAMLPMQMAAFGIMLGGAVVMLAGVVLTLGSKIWQVVDVIVAIQSDREKHAQVDRQHQDLAMARLTQPQKLWQRSLRRISLADVKHVGVLKGSWSNRRGR